MSTILLYSQNYKFSLLFTTSILVNVLFISSWYNNNYRYENEGELSWSKAAAAEAEAVATISCSGHGRAYLDGLILPGNQFPVCECNTCYGGPLCSILIPNCSVNADSGDPLFLEPFWVKHAASSAIVVAGWHRMSYTFNDLSLISQQLENHIRKIHSVVGNAITEGTYILFSVGSIQLLNAAVHALSPVNASSPARVVASIPFYPVYHQQTNFFQSMEFKFEGDASLWKNYSSTNADLIEFVTSPNNPDGKLNKAVLSGHNVKTIHDYAYYWPHFTPIPSPADEDVMLFSISKLTGHAGSRFGWAVMKDKAIYERMSLYLRLNTLGVSRDTQLRALKLLQVVLQQENGIYEFGYATMRKRWERLNSLISMSKRFSIQKIAPTYCTYFHILRDPSPAYAWLKCEREEDADCHAVLKAANIDGRPGKLFFAGDQYVRLSLIRRQDDFDLLIQKLSQLVPEKQGGPESV